MNAGDTALGELRDLGRQRLGGAQALDVDVLLQAATGASRASLTAFPERRVDSATAAVFRGWLEQRGNGTPIAYLVGHRDFWTLTLRVTPAVLIPRPETEHLVERALARLPEQAARLIDAGTGSGAVALALASERPSDEIIALDASRPALQVAADNRHSNQLPQVKLLASSWLSGVRPQPHWHAIVSNPPYLSAQDRHLELGDLRFEPRDALTDHADGLDAIRTLCEQARQRLLPGGWLILEHGYDQAEAVRDCLKQAGYQLVVSNCDLAGHERVTEGQWP
jgi:release factor glutamine methyltransferase